VFGSCTTSSKEFHASTDDPVFYSLSSVSALLLTTLHTILIAERLCFLYGCNEPQDSIERLEATNTILLMELQSVVTTRIQLNPRIQPTGLSWHLIESAANAPSGKSVVACRKWATSVDFTSARYIQFDVSGEIKKTDSYLIFLYTRFN
jgi:hypothetical protein